MSSSTYTLRKGVKVQSSKPKRNWKGAVVFAVPRDESSSNYHEVVYARDGDLNRAAQRGNIKRFRDWRKAVKFAHLKGEDWGAEVIIHSYGTNPIRTYYYPKPEKKPRIISRLVRISRRTPRISHKVPRLS